VSISGIVVKTAPEHLETVMAALEASGLCEIHFHDPGGKIVVTVEGEGEGDDVRKMREIMDLPHVLCVDLAWSYHADR
jgi:nitrate reductase NapD